LGAFRRSFDAHGDRRDAKIEAAGGATSDPGFASVSARACLLFARDLCVSDKNIYKVVAGISRTPLLRTQMILGLLYKAKKKGATSIDPYQSLPYIAMAVKHLTEAKRILSQFGQTPTLARVDTALAGLGQ
jgi:hypothetical protein